MVKTGNLRFLGFPMKAKILKRGRIRLLLTQRSVWRANMVPSPGLCLMEFVREVVEDLGL